MPPTKRTATEGRKRVRRRNDDDEDASQDTPSGSDGEEQAVQLHERINQRGRQALQRNNDISDEEGRRLNNDRQRHALQRHMRIPMQRGSIAFTRQLQNVY